MNFRIRNMAALLGLAVLCPLLVSAETAGEARRREQSVAQAALAVAFDHLMAGVETLEILTTAPMSGWEDSPPGENPGRPKLEPWKIVRRAQVTDPAEIALLRAGLKRAIEQGRDFGPCFDPCYGLVFRQGSTAIQVRVCFQCRVLRAEGAAGFEGAAISPAVEKEFHRVLRAHGLTKPGRLAGSTDGEIARRLAGSWKQEGISRPVPDQEIRFKEIRTYHPDGTFIEQSESTVLGERGKPMVRTTEGQWRIQDRVLLVEVRTKNKHETPDPVERAIPLVEATEKSLVTGSVIPNDNTESIWERVGTETPKVQTPGSK